MFKKFQLRNPSTFLAVQYTGDNLEEIRKTLRVDPGVSIAVQEADGGFTLVQYKVEGDRPIEPGEWLVRDSDMRYYSVYSDKDFQSKYVEVSDE